MSAKYRLAPTFVQKLERLAPQSQRIVQLAKQLEPWIHPGKLVPRHCRKSPVFFSTSRMSPFLQHFVLDTGPPELVGSKLRFLLQNLRFVDAGYARMNDETAVT